MTHVDDDDEKIARAAILAAFKKWLASSGSEANQDELLAAFASGFSSGFRNASSRWNVATNPLRDSLLGLHAELLKKQKDNPPQKP